MLRSFDFFINVRYASLSASLPPHTSIYNIWPPKKVRTTLPLYQSIATMISAGANITDSSSHVLMGIPLHVIENDFLAVNVMNNVPNTGLSIHFHGFEMKNSVEYDGVVGLTQCSISPGDKFGYHFKVEESFGTYWYHTHSGNLGIDSHNTIKGPLIVHQDTPDLRRVVDKLNTVAKDVLTGVNVDYRSLLSYGNERILFFSDGFLKSDSINEMYYVSGLNPPPHLNDDRFIASAVEYEFATVNGKIREVIHVVKGQTYKLRLINGGSHFAFRITIDGFPMTIIAADSSQVEAIEVDEVILHNAERFDVEIKIPNHLESGDSFWIRADTLESRNHGYQNGARAILHIVDNMDEAFALHDHNIRDPKDDIAKSNLSVQDRRTMNCYSNLETEKAETNGKGACLPVTALNSVNGHIHLLKIDKNVTESVYHLETEVRTVDFDFNHPPLHALFTRIDNGNWYQHILSSKSHVLVKDFDPEHDLHPHAAVMNVRSHSPVIIIWRSRSLMDQ